MSVTLLPFLLTPFTFFVLAASGTPSPPPDLTGLAAVITAAIGVFGFLATLWRGRENNKKVGEIEDAASYVKGFDSLTKRLREEIEEIHESNRSDKAQWEQERRGYQEALSKLQVELSEQRSANYQVRDELSTLRGQIRGFLSAEEYDEFTKHLS